MSISNNIFNTVVLTLKDRAEGMRAVLASGLSRREWWLALVLVSVGTVIAMFMLWYLATSEVEMQYMGIRVSPFYLVIGQAFSMVATTFGIHWVGRKFGGRGELTEALAVVVWSGFLMLLFSLVAAPISLMVPGATGVLNLLSNAIYLWFLTGFVTEIHGFRSPFNVLIVIVLIMLGLLFMLAILAAPFAQV